MAENNSPRHTNEQNDPLGRHIDDEAFETQSNTSSASELQMSMLENKLENEMAKMTNMVKSTVSSLQNSVSKLTDQFERKFSQIEQKLNRIASDRGAFENINANRSTSLFGQTLHGTSNVETGNPFSLGGISQNRGDNIPPSFAQSNQSCLSSSNSNFQHNARNTQSSETTRGDNSHFKMKPQTFNGTDFDDFISQYEITCEINGWQYKEKSLYLANCLTGEARSLLNELDHEGKRDYSTLVEKLRNRFGSVNKSEIYRTQLKSRTRNKGETIPELAQAIKKLVRQAYPGVNKEVFETLSLDYFIDAITDSDLRLRLREAGPKSLEDAEQTAVRIEAYKIADKDPVWLVALILTKNKRKTSKVNHLVKLRRFLRPFRPLQMR